MCVALNQKKRNTSISPPFRWLYSIRMSYLLNANTFFLTLQTHWCTFKQHSHSLTVGIPRGIKKWSKSPEWGRVLILCSRTATCARQHRMYVHVSRVRGVCVSFLQKKKQRDDDDDDWKAGGRRVCGPLNACPDRKHIYRIEVPLEVPIDTFF